MSLKVVEEPSTTRARTHASDVWDCGFGVDSLDVLPARNGSVTGKGPELPRGRCNNADRGAQRERNDYECHEGCSSGVLNGLFVRKEKSRKGEFLAYPCASRTRLIGDGKMHATPHFDPDMWYHRRAHLTWHGLMINATTGMVLAPYSRLAWHGARLR